VKFVDASGLFEGDVAKAIIDRLVVWPGQLTAYDTGALEFFALRKRAQDTLQERFDLREFHIAVLGNGTVTLPMLHEQVEYWIASKENGNADELNQRAVQARWRARRVLPQRSLDQRRKANCVSAR
jgi:Bacterial protein of unknown function (DUF885)